MAGTNRGDTPNPAERRNAKTRAAGVWTEVERDRFIAEVREARRDAHAVTIQGGDVVQKPDSESDHT